MLRFRFHLISSVFLATKHESGTYAFPVTADEELPSHFSRENRNRKEERECVCVVWAGVEIDDDSGLCNFISRERERE